jgi:hypothetical protein
MVLLNETLKYNEILRLVPFKENAVNDYIAALKKCI